MWQSLFGADERSYDFFQANEGTICVNIYWTVQYKVIDVYILISLFFNILGRVILSVTWFHQKKFEIYVHCYMLMICLEDYGFQKTG